MIDPFKNGFTLAQLTQSINTLPNMYGRVNAMNLFTWRPGTDRTVIIELRNGTLSLVPTTPWGGVAPKNTGVQTKMRSFAIPHMPFEDTVYARDVMGVRAFGTTNELETVAGKVNEKLQSMRNKIDQTLEWRKFSALTGVVLDADGTVIENYFDAFGVQPKTFYFDFGNPDFDVQLKCGEVLSWIEDHLQGEQSTGVRALVSPEFMDALTRHKNVREIFLGTSEAAARFGNDPRKNFNYGGLVFEQYRAIVDGMRFIEPGEGHAFPEGTTDTFSNFGAPADFNETVNTLAQAYYARQKNKDFNRGIDLHVQANQLPMVARPEALAKLVIGAGQ